MGYGIVRPRLPNAASQLQIDNERSVLLCQSTNHNSLFSTNNNANSSIKFMSFCNDTSRATFYW